MVSLQAIEDVPYLVFHDAYQYFEKEYHLNPVGAVTLNPERKPGIKTMLAIEQNIELQDVQCIFHEPQFQPRLVARIAEDTGIRSGELDPIGASLAPGSELWFDLMLSLQDNLLECLQD
jgi:zinc transport system substrate-binding protein